MNTIISNGTTSNFESLLEHTRLPSPASSSGGVESETSDYQRSISSLHDEDSSSTALDYWCSDAGRQDDPGFGSEERDTPLPKELSKYQRRSQRLLSTNITLLPTSPEKSSSKIASKSNTEAETSDTNWVSYSTHKELISQCCDRNENTDAIVSLRNTTDGVSQYFSHINALRKQHLDHILNLTTTTHSQRQALAKNDGVEHTPLSSNSSHSLNLIDRLHYSSFIKKSSQTGAQTNLRFPVTKNESSTVTAVVCKWKDCGQLLESAGKLQDHLQIIHAAGHVNKCCWLGCKVFGKVSSSKQWLEKHVSMHGSNKLFQCIVDSCRLRFGTRTLLERHVNSHFKEQENICTLGCNGNRGSHTCQVLGRRSSESTSLNTPKMIRRSLSRRFRNHKSKYSARIFDHFDTVTMAKMKDLLTNLACRSRAAHISISYDEILFRGQIVARRRNPGKAAKDILVHWTPHGLIKDEWICEVDGCLQKRIKISSLDENTKYKVISYILSSRSQDFDTNDFVAELSTANNGGGSAKKRRRKNS